MSAADLKPLIVDVPDFPQPGIVFKDITPLLADPSGFSAAVELLAAHLRAFGAEELLAIESRGFIFGAALATHMNIPMHLVRKPGKLPRDTHSVSYQLEYGEDSLELHTDVIRPGAKYAIVDDVIATGGTAGALSRLVADQGGDLVGAAFLIELGFLDGRTQLPGIRVESLLTY